MSPISKALDWQANPSGGRESSSLSAILVRTLGTAWGKAGSQLTPSIVIGKANYVVFLQILPILHLDKTHGDLAYIFQSVTGVGKDEHTLVGLDDLLFPIDRDSGRTLQQDPVLAAVAV